MIIDAEHAPFDRGDIDMVVMAARASGIASLVRVAEASPSTILFQPRCRGDWHSRAPHVDSAETGGAGGIGMPLSRRWQTRLLDLQPRRLNWRGTTMAVHMAAEDERVACIAMIEDAAAAGSISMKIAATPGLDAFFFSAKGKSCRRRLA